MRQLQAEISTFTRRSRSLAISHRDHPVMRGLEPGEHVLVHDPIAEEHFTAIVSDIHFSLDDTSYRLTLGTRITDAEAADWLAPASEPDYLTTRGILELLTELRRGEQLISEAFGSAEPMPDLVISN